MGRTSVSSLNCCHTSMGSKWSGTSGAIIGLIANGFLAERFGYRRVMICALIAMTCLIFLFFFAHSLGMILAGQFLCGIPWGSMYILSITRIIAHDCQSSRRSLRRTRPRSPRSLSVDTSRPG